jgi:multidrug efflux pump subunit AcrB
MNNVTRFVIERQRFAALLLLAVLAGGMSVYLTQPRQEDPQITLRGAQVVAQFPGLSPERVEALITRPIENQIKTIPEISEIKSMSTTGMAIIIPEADIKYTDMAPIWSNLRNKMEDLAPTLPEGTQGPVVNDDYGEIAVVTMALTGEDFSARELENVAEDIADRLNVLPLVAKVDLYGVQDERIWLDFDPAFMAQFGVTAATIVRAMNAQNVVLPGGTVNANGERIVIEPSGNFESVADIENLAIETEDGSILYLQDLATIRRGYVDPPGAPAFYNGKPAVVLGVSMVESSNVVALGAQVRGALGELTPLLPAGMALDIAIFQPDLVQASVNSATSNLLQTVAVVLVVVMLFLGWKTGLIVGAMVPLTMMATLIVMSVTGIELHRVSIAAIIVALGLLVDNGVVVAEDIRKQLDQGVDRLTAALSTPKSLGVPLLTSSLTTVAAFLPLVLVEDGSGEFLRSLGQVLAIALLASWLISITVTPALCYWFLREAPASGGDSDADDAGGYAWYGSVLAWLLANRLLFVLLMVGLLIGAVLLFGIVKQRSLGPSERNQFTVYLDLPAQAHIDETIKAAKRLSGFLTDETRNPEVTDVLTYVGAGGPRFFLALSPNDPQPNKAFLVVNTETSEQLPVVMARIDEFFLTDMPGAMGRSELLFLGPAALGTVELKIIGPDVDTLRRLAQAHKAAFRSVADVQALRDDWENPVVKLRVELDQARARRAGVTSEEVARTLSGHFDGFGVSSYREGDRSIPIVVRAEADARGSLDQLRAIEIISVTGSPVPLVQVADIQGDLEPSRIRRVDQERAITIAGKHPEMTAVELYEAMGSALAEIEIPVGYRVELEGEIKGAAESNSKLLGFAPHALFIIVSLLVLQFNSFRRPAIILLTIPLVLIGGVGGLVLTQAYFDFTAMLGLFSLAGIIINNGIVLVDRVDQGRAAGLAVDDAIREAALIRARPIIMTTITTVVGLLPLALFGGEFWFGMAVVIMGGLAVGTLLTLGFVPVLYSLFFKARA